MLSAPSARPTGWWPPDPVDDDVLDDLVPAPRQFAERVFDVRDWVDEPSGGHFGAWDRPEAYAAGLRRAVALTR